MISRQGYGLHGSAPFHKQPIAAKFHPMMASHQGYGFKHPIPVSVHVHAARFRASLVEFEQRSQFIDKRGGGKSRDAGSIDHSAYRYGEAGGYHSYVRLAGGPSGDRAVGRQSYGYTGGPRFPGHAGRLRIDGGRAKPADVGAAPPSLWHGNYGKGVPGANEQLVRLGPAAYDDGKGSLAGADRPNPRAISNVVAKQDGDTINQKGASALFWQWGQFIDHDLDLTKVGSGIRADIAVPKGDPAFDPHGTGTATIPFERSNAIIDENGVRQQTNNITPLLDGSMVYGLDAATTHTLRSFEGGHLKLSAGGLLPTNEKGEFVAGDERVGEQPGLTSMHTLFAREHNRVADLISQRNPYLTDEQVFQTTKRYVTAEIQAITKNEYLPLLLGSSAPSIGGYHPGATPQISNEFASAAYRFGHSLVNGSVQIVGADGSAKELSLKDVFNNPSIIKENGIDGILRGQSSQFAQALDPLVVEDLRSSLFGAPGAGGLDLASLNIQRGRDHGLPSWNDTREAMDLRRIESFNDPVLMGDFGRKLAEVYDSPNQVDLWVGGLAEKSYGNSMLGETFTIINAEQFARTMAGDRNWYEWSMAPSDVAWLNSITLSDIVRWNSGVDDIDNTAMIAADNGAYA